MAEYIDRSAFLEQKRAWYCKNCIRRTNSKGKIVYEIGEAPCRACGIGDVLDDLEDVPAADVRPVVKATWEKVTEQPYFRKHYHVVLWLVLLAENGETKAGGIAPTAAQR